VAPGQVTWLSAASRRLTLSLGSWPLDATLGPRDGIRTDGSIREDRRAACDQLGAGEGAGQPPPPPGCPLEMTFPPPPLLFGR
jgi:hypothetical protein